MGTTERQRTSANGTSEKSASAEAAHEDKESAGRRAAGAASATGLAERTDGGSRDGETRAAEGRGKSRAPGWRAGAEALGRRAESKAADRRTESRAADRPAGSGSSGGREYADDRGSAKAAEQRGHFEALDDGEYAERRPLWVDEPARRPRLPDPVRKAAVRAVLIVSLTLIQAMTAFFCAMAESWLAFPMVLSSVASTVVATWGVCDVWVTRQVWNQRNGVVSMPSSTARRLRRERRRARRQARVAARAKEGIRSRGGQGQLSHS